MNNRFPFFIPALLLFSLSCSHQKLEQSNLPILIITAPSSIPDEPKTKAHLKIIDNGPGKINAVNDTPNGYDGSIGIEMRGSSSQQLSDKKPYGFETQNKKGKDLKVSLLGMPPESDWVLIAPYSDKSLMRDALAYQLAGEIMAYSPRMRFCELVLNGTYQGVYVLGESIKRDSNRVAISKLNDSDVSGDAVTGGYILKIDKTTGSSGDDGWRSPDTYYQFHYPKPNQIKPEQREYIIGYLKKFELLMQSADYNSPDSGYSSMIDIGTFIDFVIINEISRNVDGYRLSTFLYKDKDSKDPKLKVGPVWDFNIAFGNVNYCAGNETTGFAYNFNTVCPNDAFLIPFWWTKLVNDPAFQKKLNNRWKQLRQNKFTNAALLQKVDSTANLLKDAAPRNFQRWPILNSYEWPNSFIGGTYNAEVNFLKSWLEQRVQWLDNAWQEQ